MSNPYVGEIRVVGFNFVPQGWAACDGSLISISENSTLFSLIGTTYGGDGQNTFALPDLRGRTPVHLNGPEEYILGSIGGAEDVTIQTSQIPTHSHVIGAVHTNGAAPTPAGAMFAASSAGQFVPVASATGSMGNMVSVFGEGMPHSNLQPYLVLNCLISLFGIYPSQD